MELRKYKHLLTQNINKSSTLSNITVKTSSQNSTTLQESVSQNNPSKTQQIKNIADNTIKNLQQQSYDKIQGLKQSISQMQPFVLLGICVGAVLVLTIVIVICWRRYHTRRLYQQSPQNFSSKPNLNPFQLWKFQRKQIKSLTSQNDQKITMKQTYDGKFVEVIFNSPKNCIYFENELTKNCYFQVQILRLSSVIQIGFVHKQDINLLGKQNSNQINFDQYGISVKTDGSVIIYNSNKLDFPWKIQYGDTIGIGITYNESTKSKRVWITKNGVVQNPPSQQQQLRQIQVDNQKNGQTIAAKKDKQQEDSNQEYEKAYNSAIAARMKIQLKTRNFDYYAVIASQSPPNSSNKQSIINWNLGAMNFRLHQKNLHGLLD